jgi:putative SOS response-associated peptidase YedK
MQRVATCSPEADSLPRMCNLYSITRTQEAMRRLFRVKRDLTGNLPDLPAVFPDMMAPVVRTASDGERELSLMRWGLPATAEPRHGAGSRTCAM